MQSAACYPAAYLYSTGLNGDVIVPKGHLKIAQRFIAGWAETRTPWSPEGTTEPLGAIRFSRPSGTGGFAPFGFPAVNCWAIFICPSGTTCCCRVTQPGRLAMSLCVNRDGPPPVIGLCTLLPHKLLRGLNLLAH